MEYGPGFVSTFLYYFVTTSLVATFVASQGLGLSLSTGVPEQLGVLIGLAAGLLGGIVNRTVAFSVAFENKDEFEETLTEALNAMGYHHARDDEDGVAVYVRSPLRQLLSGKVFVKLDAKEATIASRSIHATALRRRL